MGSGPGERLESWKQIAAYLQRDVRTVQRWEKREGLPVRRHQHERLSSVSADTAELDAWLEGRRSGPVPSRAKSRSRLLAAAAAAVALMALVWGLLHWGRAPGELTERRIWEGPDPTRLGNVSADGRLVCYADPETRDLTVADLTSGARRRLTAVPPKARYGGAFYPVFSPDSRSIAFGWDAEAGFEFRRIGADGSGDTVLIRHPRLGSVLPFEWNAAGFILAAMRWQGAGFQLAAIDPAAGGWRVLADLGRRQPSAAGVSPDGRWVALDLPKAEGDHNRELFLVSSQGGSLSPLTDHPDRDQFLGWTPDGGRILFACDRSGAADGWLLAVSGGRAAGEPTLAKKNLGFVRPMRFARNGTFYYAMHTALTDVYLATLDPATGSLLEQPRPLSHQSATINTSPDWSPDGKALAWLPVEVGPARWPRCGVMLAWPGRKDNRSIELPLHSLEILHWFPDNRSLAACGVDLAGAAGLYRIDAETGRLSTLLRSTDSTRLPQEALPAPGGRTLYYKERDRQSEPARLLALDLQTGRSRRLLDSVYRFALSPDGRRMVYSTFDHQRERIRILNLAGGEAKEIHSEPRAGRIVSVAWPAGAQYILFAKRGRLYRVPCQGGPAAKLPLTMEGLRDLRPHPDGRRLAFTAGTTNRGELWAIRGLAARR